MKILLLTRDGPRHLHLAHLLREAGCEVTLAIERGNGLPQLRGPAGASVDAMLHYSQLVEAAQVRTFGRPSVPRNHLSLDLTSEHSVDQGILRKVEISDLVLIFGTSLIRGQLFELLQANGALNLHIGLAPYYLGSACNFWAMYDRRPDLVGGTVQLLSKSVDSGPILFHSRPVFREQTVFDFTMEAVLAVQRDLADAVARRKIFAYHPAVQEQDHLIRKSLRSDFKTGVVQEFLKRSRDEMFPVSAWLDDEVESRLLRA